LGYANNLGHFSGHTKVLKVTLRRKTGMSTSPEFMNPLLERNNGTSLLMLRMTTVTTRGPMLKCTLN